jgi:Uma2 family endonuclease
MPGIDHELFKTVIGILIETYLIDREIEFIPTGSMPQKIEGLVSAEADESYQIEGRKLAIEVNFTSGDESKLECYRLLAIDEVWLWEDGLLACHHLQTTGYQQANRSQIPALSTINFSILSTSILLGETSRCRSRKVC